MSTEKHDQHDLAALFASPVEDPAQNLPETARKILDACRTLLLRGGFEALRWDAIAAESGKNKSAIKYYFGNTEGLVSAIVASLEYETCLAFVEQARGITGEERIEHFVSGQRELASGVEYTLFFALLPAIVRNDGLRARIATTYDWYYKMTVEWLGLTDRLSGDNRADYVAAASLMTAIVDGLAIQAAVQPRGFDMDKVLHVLEYFLEHSLGDFLASVDEQQGSAPDPD